MKQVTGRWKIGKTLGVFLAMVVAAAQGSPAQNPPHAYPVMAPLSQYLMADRDAEIALARSAAPKSITGDATVLVLGPHGYVTAVKGKNGFVCLVDRAWTAQFDFPEFWNPRLRGPMCLNPPAARSILPMTFKRTELALAGRSKDQIMGDIKAALASKAFPPLEPGAMCYMMSKQGYLNDEAGHWVPHLMFYTPLGTNWGADLPGSPVMLNPQFHGLPEPIDEFMIPTDKWSDGTPAPSM
ncbi:hypothetical protein [Rhodanobacter sp. 7MK24]|uniref:hypothetical protein n=1 Tax=Rhodanobacter sp. 7MK24 TaxID=2775922 RepID=UPI001CE1D25E|nr:hypothetical protein [Rhodanobacter sp. 7MK24]